MKIIYICVLLCQKHAHIQKGKQVFIILELVKNMLYLIYAVARLNFTSLTVARFTQSDSSDPYFENFSTTVPIVLFLKLPTPRCLSRAGRHGSVLLQGNN